MKLSLADVIKARRPLLLGAAGLFVVLLVLLLGHRLSLRGVDPDAVDFDRVTVGAGRYLICPANLCQSRDEEAPVLTISAQRLTQKLRAVAVDELKMREVALPVENQFRFVDVSPVLRFERVIDVRIIARSSGASTFAILARPASPAFDLAATRARMERLLEGIAR